MRVFTYCTPLTRLTLGLFYAFFGTHCSTWSVANQRAQGHYPLEFPGDPQVPDTLPVFKTPGHKGIHTSAGHRDIPYSQQNDQFTKIQVDSTEGKVFFYFPVDGHQPTTEQAARWSQANTDNDPNSPITKWYMRMFGWTDPTNPGDVALHMGFFKITLEPISIFICYDGNSTTHPARPGIIPSESPFWQYFRQIACCPVGRLLLYRLLIEIRRQPRTSNNSSVCRTEFSNLFPDATANYPDLRNNNLCITINRHSVKNSFIYENGEMFFALNSTPCSVQTVTKLNTRSDSVGIALSYCPYDVILFHEMNHWFHFLRSPSRYLEERQVNAFSIDGSTRNENQHKLNDPDFATIFLGIKDIGYQFWGDLSTENPSTKALKLFISAKPWLAFGRNERYYFINFEEIRNILGTDPTFKGYLQGDDLSENLYRFFKNLPLRMGHGTSAYYESKSVIEKALFLVQNTRLNFLPSSFALLDIPIITPPFKGLTKCYFEGLKGCYYPKSAE